jgi:predicted DNA-binding transcriptional regulator YafY
MTARDLASELEVSERTIYRDINALSGAGIPVYGEPGPEGGYALLDDYRTNLTGLTETEVRALFMLSIPTPLADLGESQNLKSALLKLSAALPATRRHDEELVRQRILIDSTWWNQSNQRVPYIQAIHQAIWQDRKLHIGYQLFFQIPIEQVVDPYSLVAKAGIWFLVWASKKKIRAQRVSNLTSVRITNEYFVRPPDFDLPAFWKDWCDAHKSLMFEYKAYVRIAPEFVPMLPHYFGREIYWGRNQGEKPDDSGSVYLELSFESFEAARERILGFGRGVEVLEPLQLRRSILDYAEQITSLYQI